MLCLRDYPQNLIKYENNRASKIPISQLISELGKTWKFNLGSSSKIPSFLFFFMIWKKLRSPARARLKNPKISLLIRKDQRQPRINTQKITILDLWINWQNVCPNLSFTVENKIGNLHKIRLLTFQT